MRKLTLNHNQNIIVCTASKCEWYPAPCCQEKSTNRHRVVKQNKAPTRHCVVKDAYINLVPFRQGNTHQPGPVLQRNMHYPVPCCQGNKLVHGTVLSRKQASTRHCVVKEESDDSAHEVRVSNQHRHNLVKHHMTWAEGKEALGYITIIWGENIILLLYKRRLNKIIILHIKNTRSKGIIIDFDCLIRY